MNLLHGWLLMRGYGYINIVDELRFYQKGVNLVT